MKKIKLLFLITLISQLFFACKKDGELIEAKSYGSFNISSTTTAEVGNLLVDVDGKITDTLKAPSATKTIKTYVGKRKIKIYQPGKSGTPVVDTTLDIEGITSKLTFLYTGDLKIIGGGYDGSTKPAAGNSLVQFVNLDKSLPPVLNMKIYEIYYNEAGDYFTDEVTAVKGISRTGFTPYLELPPPKHVDDGFGGYYFEVFNAANNEKLVDILTDFPTIYFDLTGGSVFISNKVMSLGILKDPGSGTFISTVIYDTEIK
ncbi:hypothetical protein AAFN85_28245 [Mucilaginibacter sp. CAU 1740]|uniref:hypothetical protein n=1 Tax=Mucilaginibacter sp. CAU 1740 TaxID=3140365 RepID=UPI00325C33A5